MPADWQDGIIITLYKGKGPRTLCCSYRPITLLSLPGKVFAHVSLQPLLDRTHRLQQSGFTAGRSAIDAILALLLLSEILRELNRLMHVSEYFVMESFRPRKLSPRISTTSDLRQGCILTPVLFCVTIDWIIKHMSFNPRITTDLVYADYTALLMPSARDAACLLYTSDAADE